MLPSICQDMLVHVRFRNRSFDCVCQFLVWAEVGSGKLPSDTSLTRQAGWWINPVSHSPVTPDAHGPAHRARGPARCCLCRRCQTWNYCRRYSRDAWSMQQTGGRLLSRCGCIFTRCTPPPPCFRCRPQRSRCSPRRRCSRHPPVADGAGGWWMRTRMSVDGSSWKGTEQRRRDADRREKYGWCR